MSDKLLRLYREKIAKEGLPQAVTEIVDAAFPRTSKSWQILKEDIEQLLEATRVTLTAPDALREALELASSRFMQIANDMRATGNEARFEIIGFGKDAAKAVAALAAPRAEGWQDISTAPKDGTEISTWNGYSVCQCWFEDGLWRVFAPRDSSQVLYSFNPQPTHWQPLPQQPENNESVK